MLDPKVYVCLARLEDLVADFLHELSIKAEDKWVALTLDHISRESRNHAQLLKDMCRVAGINEKVNDEQCRSLLGEMGSEAISRYKDMIARLRSGWTPRREKLIEILREELNVEKMAGEEAYMKIVAGVMPAICEEKLVIMLFRELSAEEEHHSSLLKAIIRKLEENVSEKNVQKV